MIEERDLVYIFLKREPASEARPSLEPRLVF